jgi:hypothetical protein
LFIVLVILASCGPKTRTITPLSESDKSNIKKVAINIEVDEELDANISTIKQRYWTSALDSFSGSCDYSCILLIPIVLAWIVTEETVRSTMDHGRESEFNEDISNINMEEVIAEQLDEYSQTIDVYFEAEMVETQSPSILAQQGFDTILDISVDDLRVQLCPKQYVAGYIEERQGGEGPLSSDDTAYSREISRWNAIYPEYILKANSAVNNFLYSADTQILSKEESEHISKLEKEAQKLRPMIEKYAHNSARTWITYKGKLISISDGHVLWEWEALYFDPKCENVEEMQANSELVVDMLTRAIGDIAVNVVNEIQ